MSPAPDLGTLVERAGHENAGVRRVALFDLIRRDDGVGVALRLLPSERDERTAIAAVRALASSGREEAIQVLAELRDDPSSSAPLAHAATLAHDALETKLSRRTAPSQ